MSTTTQHRVTITKFTPSDLDGKTLRWFRDEMAKDYTMMVGDVQPNLSFIVRILQVWIAPDSFHSPEQRGQFAWEKESLDQQTVDKIVKTWPAELLRGSDFVIFEESPATRELCEAKD
jgi:hypothetical protein